MNKLVLSLMLLCIPLAANADSTYQVDEIYQVYSVEYGTIALDRYGKVVDVSELLVPAELDPGTYEITVTRKDTNLYKIDGYNYYIKTRLCLELSIRQTAYLEVSGLFSKLTFVSRF